MTALTLATGGTCLALAMTITALVWGALRLARTPRPEKE